MSNHLFIGLGGTGCAVVREFKKLLFSEWRRKGNRGPAPDIYTFSDPFGGVRQEVRIATLSVDSNHNDLTGQLDKWRVLGEQLSLRDNEKVLLNPQGLGNVMANLHQYPGIEPWISQEREQVGRIVKGTDKPNGCNQIRRLGRLALANGGNLSNLLSAFTGRRSALTEGASLDITIHIACTLACGTGSGTLVDTISQLRRVLNDEQGSYPIHLYLFATSSDVGEVNTGNFYANQYSAMQELNALRLGLYKPWDISGKDGKKRLTVRDPFDSAFIITDATEGARGLTLVEQVNSVAEFVFQKLVRLMGNVPQRLAMSHTFEDVAAYPTDDPDSDRSTRFASFGVKRFSIPEQEIHEKLTYSFVSQAIRRLLYDNWSGQDGEGYVAAARQLSADGFVEKRKEAWRIAPGRLNLDTDRPDQAEDPYPVYLDDWSGKCIQYAEEIRITFPKSIPSWMAAFDAILEQYWRYGFRGRGVENYFSVRSEAGALVNRARQLVEAVEQDLLHGMENLLPEYQAHHFPDIIRRAKTHLQLASSEFSQELKDLDAAVQTALADAEKNRAEMEKVGRLAIMLGGSHLRIFSAYVKARQDYYYLETLRRADEYALELINRAAPEFGMLELRAEEFVRKLKKLEEDHRNLVTHRIVEKRAGAEDFTRDVISYVNVPEVNASIGALLTDESIQKANAKVVADALKSLRPQGRRDGFERYNELAPDLADGKIGGEVVQVINGVSFPYSREVHDQRRLNDARFVPILGQNIVEKLHRDHGGRAAGELEARIRKFMEAAMPAAAFDGGATPVGHFGVSSPIFGRSVFLPECDTIQPEFREQLKELISGMSGGGNGRMLGVEVVDVPAGRNSTELVFLSVAYFFPLRMLKTLQSLSGRHAARLRAGEEDGEFQTTTETHRPPLPSLLKADAAELRRQALPYVLLAEALKLIRIPEVQGGGESILAVADLDEEFQRLLDPVKLTNVACTRSDRETCEKEEYLKKQVPLTLLCLVNHYEQQFQMANPAPLQAKLAPKLSVYRTFEQKQELGRELDRILNKVFFIKNNAEDDATYQFFVSGAKEAKKIIESVVK